MPTASRSSENQKLNANIGKESPTVCPGHIFDGKKGKTTNLKLWLLMLAMLSLSIAVVNWGLQYKMSLYQTSHTSPHQPVAKLWNGSDDNAKSTHLSAPLQQPTPLLIKLPFLIVFLAIFAARTNHTAYIAFFRWHRIRVAWKLALAPFQTVNFLRPPPLSA